MTTRSILIAIFCAGVFVLVLTNFTIWQEIGIFNYPSRAGKVLVINTAQAYGNEHAAQDGTRIPAHSAQRPLTDEEAFVAVDVAGGHAYTAEEIKRRGLAKAEGRTLPTDGVYISARDGIWTPVTNAYGQQIEVTAGEVILGAGEVCSFYLHGGCVNPDGLTLIPDTIADYLPFARECNPWALCGMIEDKFGGQHVFQIGQRAVAPASGKLYAVVNVPSRGPYGLDQDMFNARTSKGFRIQGVEAQVSSAELPQAPRPQPKPTSIKDKEEIPAAPSTEGLLVSVYHRESP